MSRRAAKPSSKDAPSDGATPPDPTSKTWFNRKWLLICCACIALLVAASNAGASWGMLIYRLFAEGGIALLWLLAAGGFGWRLVRNGRPHLPTLLRLVVAVALGLGLISLAVLLLGLAGWLSRASAWSILLLGLLCCPWRNIPPRAQQGAAWLRLHAGWGTLWLAAMPVLGLALACATTPPGVLWQDEPAGYDVTEYHLQIPREWYESGRISGLKHNVFSYMPMNVEMHDLLAMHLHGGPYGGMYLAQFMHVAWMTLAVTATAAAAGALFPGKSWATPLAGTAMAMVPWTFSLAPIAYNESGLLLFGTLAIALALTADHWRIWALAGAFAGLACGVKLTAVAMVAGAVLLAMLLTIVATCLRERPATPRRDLLHLALFGVMTLATFSPWLIRNGIWTCNPVFPEAMESLGKGHYSDVQVVRWRKAHSPTAQEQAIGARLVAARSRIIFDWRYGYLLIPLAAVAAVLGWNHRCLLLLAILLVQLVVWLFFTHLQSRFFILLIPIGAMLLVAPAVKSWPWLAGGVVVIMGTIGFATLHPRCEIVSKMGQAGLLGAEDLHGLVPFDLDALPKDRPLWLIGDAQAFWYSNFPMSKLRYCTVFDVPPRRYPLMAWRDHFGKPTDHPLELIFPGELSRLTRTYDRVPYPAQAIGGRTAPFVLNTD